MIHRFRSVLPILLVIALASCSGGAEDGEQPSSESRSSRMSPAGELFATHQAQSEPDESRSSAADEQSMTSEPQAIAPTQAFVQPTRTPVPQPPTMTPVPPTATPRSPTPTITRATATPTVTPTRTPRSAPTPTSQTTVPREGDVLLSDSFASWPSEYPSESGDPGWMEPHGNGYLMGVYPDTNGYIQEAWTERNNFADISASVDVRQLTDGVDSAGCLSVRHDASQGDYSLCVSANGQSWASHYYADASGTWQVEDLWVESYRLGSRKPSQWNTLKIIAKGNQLWFVVNNTVLGSVDHNARSAGAVAVSVINWDPEKEAEFEFQDLRIHDVQ